MRDSYTAWSGKSPHNQTKKINLIINCSKTHNIITLLGDINVIPTDIYKIQKYSSKLQEWKEKETVSSQNIFLFKISDNTQCSL